MGAMLSCSKAWHPSSWTGLLTQATERATGTEEDEQLCNPSGKCSGRHAPRCDPGADRPPGKTTLGPLRPRRCRPCGHARPADGPDLLFVALSRIVTAAAARRARDPWGRADPLAPVSAPRCRTG